MIMIFLIVMLAIGAANLLASMASVLLGRPIARSTPSAVALLPSAFCPGVAPFVSVRVAIHDEPS